MQLVAFPLASTRYRRRRCAHVDHVLSRKLDRIILQLDAHPRGLRRAALRLRKRWLERNIPTVGEEGGR
jgi:hypothetical protein